MISIDNSLRRLCVKRGIARAVALVDVGLRERFDFGVMVIREILSYFQDYGNAPAESMRLKYRKDEVNWWKEACKGSGRLRSKAQIRKRRTSSSEREIIMEKWVWKQINWGWVRHLRDIPCERVGKVICWKCGTRQSVVCISELEFKWWCFEQLGGIRSWPKTREFWAETVGPDYFAIHEPTLTFLWKRLIIETTQKLRGYTLHRSREEGLKIQARPLH